MQPFSSPLIKYQRIHSPEQVHSGVTDDISQARVLAIALGMTESVWHIQQSMIDAFDANITVLDKFGRILLVNHHWCQFSGANGGSPNAAAWIGKNYLDSICAPEPTNPQARVVAAEYDAADIRHAIEQIIHGQREHFACTYPCHSLHERRWFELRAHRLPHGQEQDVSCVLIQHINITQSYVNLCELQAANDELQALTYSLAHDLRTPLRAIHGYASMVGEHINPATQTEPQRLLRKIKDAAEEVASMLEYVMQAVRMVTAELHIEPIDLAEKAKVIWQQVCGAYAVERQIQPALRIRHAMPVLGDRILLHSVLMNLLSNAVKYAHPDRACEVSFSAELLVPPGGLRPILTYVLTDNGIGFETRDAEHLFRPFYRLHMGRGIAGFGLGLALTKRVIERHGGMIWATGSPGKGATFYFTLG
ncbi:sensor histidine kinase [Parvibium lacunae]|uniref:histidine kinase n=1 Tax=Parvibium lacunae TaxID=1888893 RepID=A0A368L738_9BURK|nr:HAMP domain-containing sensor histidine kinase [Parvibium lacunae]RCS59480.1 hypothetical protein DU000_01755 [Parvibium lacunae]